MATQSISQSSQVLVGKPTSIEKTIPVSNIKVTFNVQKTEDNRTVIQASVTIKKDNQVSETIPNVAMKDFPGSLDDQSFDEIVRALKERAIDYIRNKVIFLPANPLNLCKKWEREKSKACNEMLKEQMRIIEKDPLSVRTVDAYLELGNAYTNTSNYRDALLCYHQLYLVAEKIGLREGVGLAHNGVGHIYSRMGEVKRAISHHEKDLEIAEEIPEKRGEIHLRVYSNLGGIYESCNDWDRAEDYFNEYLFMASSLYPPNPEEVADALANLGRIYAAKGEYQRAEEVYRKSIKTFPNLIASNALAVLYISTGKLKKAVESFKELLEQTDNPSDRSYLYSNLGAVFEELGQLDRALQYHFKDLEIAQQIGEAESEARACHNIGKVFIAKGEYEKGVDYCVKKALPLAKSLGDRQLQAMILGALGVVYFRFGEYEEATECHQAQLEIATEIEDLEGQGTAHSGLGSVYFSLDQYELAIQSYQKAIAAAQQNEDREAEASALYHLGRVFEWTEQYSEAIQHFQRSIRIYLDLQRENCQDNIEWQITLFESQYRSFRCLEKALQSAQKTGEALLAADSSRAKSLVHLLNRKLQLSAPSPLSVDKIQEMARKLQTFFVIYSCDPFDETKAWCRVISSAGDIRYYPLNLTQTSRHNPTWENGRVSTRGREELKGEKIQEAITKWIAYTEIGATRGPENDEIEQEQDVPEIFKGWYEDFIAPIESFLPGQGQRVTIIPDAFLHDLPFALFQDPQGNYLFEKYTLMMAPSIETLVRLEELDQKQTPQRAFENISVVTSGQANPEYGVCELKEVKREGEAVACLFPKSFPPIHEASVEELKAIVTKGGCLHLACHGLASEKENKHSVFEGALVMKDRLLYAEDIASLPLNASLAVLSACHSGQGKLYREGSIGLPFALLAAGVSSVIATRWKIFDKATHLIVSEFYRHYLGQSEQAQQMLKAGKLFGPAEALREAMLYAKQRWPQYPQAWGAFFLVGLPNPSHRIEASPASQEATTMDTKPHTWINQTDGNQFQFVMKEGIVIARFLPKNIHGEKAQTEVVFQESEIRVQMITLTQVHNGTMQDVRSFNTLTHQQKEEILASLTQRRVRIIGKEIRILALN
jgi:CHAT domain-containing protein/Tfp pilus assembly protein PilF